MWMITVLTVALTIVGCGKDSGGNQAVVFNANAGGNSTNICAPQAETAGCTYPKPDGYPNNIRPRACPSGYAPIVIDGSELCASQPILDQFATGNYALYQTTLYYNEFPPYTGPNCSTPIDLGSGPVNVCF